MKRAAVLSAVILGGSLLVFALRYVVLGGVGGYRVTVPLHINIDVTVYDLLQGLFLPLVSLPREPKPWLAVVVAGLCLTSLPLLWPSRARRAVTTFGLLWLGIVVAFHIVTKAAALYNLYFLVLGAAFLLAPSLDLLVRRVLTPQPRVPHAWAAGLLRALPGLVVLLVGASVLRASPLLVEYPEWRTAAGVTRTFLAAVQPCLRDPQEASVVNIHFVPRYVAAETPTGRIALASVLAGYAVPAAVKLHLERRDLVSVRAVSFADLPPEPGAITVDCTPAGTDTPAAITRYSGQGVFLTER